MHAPDLPDSSGDLALAARALADGRLVAFPTETVFGLGANALDPAAVARIFAAKGRPADHPLIVHVSDPALLDTLAIDVPDYARALAAAFWPGPLTLILPRSPIVPDAVTGGQPTVGVRVPSHPVALELLRAFEALGGRGVAAPSANRFGRVSPTTAQAVRDELGAHLEPGDLVVEGEPSHVGIESTIVDCTGPAPVILRPGAVTGAVIEATTGLALGERHERIRVSGSLASHYAPTAAVVLDVEPRPGDGLIALADVATPEGVVRLASPATAEQYAQRLYAALRDADARGLGRVVAVTPSGEGIAAAIRDRLQRAAHGSVPGAASSTSPR
ncbi:L-threonylcarbamoyladenylate synthase [Microcella alkalica]|uniref:L-threonylcarbamoyladenylate synthase n=1 Tax=Microcella alkalica TaxID=355930 RepID=UPI00145E433F|nr:L-threonylcarbamoyladenylate synthase [Microcella alkalica]